MNEADWLFFTWNEVLKQAIKPNLLHSAERPNVQQSLQKQQYKTEHLHKPWWSCQIRKFRDKREKSYNL